MPSNPKGGTQTGLVTFGKRRKIEMKVRVILIALLLSALSACDTRVDPDEGTQRPHDGLKVVFPEELRPCKAMGQSGAFIGFSAVLDKDVPCNALDANFEAVIAVTTHPVVRGDLFEWHYLCGYPAPDLLDRVEKLDFDDRVYYRCAAQMPDGDIYFELNAFGDKGGNHGLHRYTASLYTNTDRLSQDLRTFRKTLRSIEIAFPSPDLEEASDFAKKPEASATEN